MVYLIIAIAVLVIVGPALAVLPSKRQKQQMAMRRQAMARGVRVELTRIEDPDPDPQAYLSSTGKPLERVMPVVAYCLNRPRPQGWRQLPPADWILVRRKVARVEGLPPGWLWLDSEPGQLTPALRQFLAARLSELPDDVVRVEEQQYVLAVYWRERGGEESVANILDFMRDCVTIPALPEDAMKRLPDSGAGQ